MSSRFSDSAVGAENLSGIKNQTPDLVVRRETCADGAWIEQLHAAAFGPGRFARTAFRVREVFERDQGLSLVAQHRGKPVGSVWMTPISLSGETGYFLGPLAIDPAFRNLGAGRLLVREASKTALAGGSGNFVLLVGDAPYYAPLGYVQSCRGQIVFPGPVDPERVLVHCRDRGRAGALAGPIAACEATQ